MRRQLPLVGGLGVAVLLALLYGLHATDVLRFPLLDRLEAWSRDARFRLRGPRRPRDDRIVIIGLDDKARAEVPKLHQERRVWARFIDRIAAAKPRVIGIDYIFDTPEEILPPRLARAVERQLGRLDELLAGGELEPGIRAALEGLRGMLREIRELTRGDEKLGQAFGRAGNVVPAVLFRFPGEGGAAGRVGRIGRAAYAEAVVPRGVGEARLPPRAVGVAGITGALADQGRIRSAGFVNNIVEDDGASRRFYTAILYGTQVFAPLALQVIRLHLGIPRGELGFVAGRSDLSVGRHRIRVDHRGRMIIDFLGPRGTFKTISAADVMAGRVDPRVLRDKIVLIGPNDTANIDKAITPFDPLLPGVELHATAIHNILHGESLREAGWLVNLTLVLGLGVLAALLLAGPIRHRLVWLLAGSLGLVLLHLVLAWVAFGRGVLTEVVFPTVALLGVIVTGLLLGFFTEGLEKRRIRTLFQHYLHADVIRELTRDPARLKLGGERREVTVLFSDIRGFSRLAEQLTPEELTVLVNEYLTPMTDAVLDEQGFLDKYIGDAIMALFGAPRAREDHALLGARTALVMLDRLAELNRRWADREWAPMAIGIGLNSGEVSLGNFGSQRRIEYTAIGDTVNLASRLEGLNKVYGTAILVGERFKEKVQGDYWVREVDLVRVKGKAIATPIFELLGPRDQACPVDLDRHAEALGAYREARWDDARAGFRQVLDGRPDDGPSQTFLARIDRLEAAGVTTETWDGVTEMETK